MIHNLMSWQELLKAACGIGEKQIDDVVTIETVLWQLLNEVLHRVYGTEVGHDHILFGILALCNVVFNWR